MTSSRRTPSLPYVRPYPPARPLTYGGQAGSLAADNDGADGNALLQQSSLRVACRLFSPRSAKTASAPFSPVPPRAGGPGPGQRRGHDDDGMARGHLPSEPVRVPYEPGGVVRALRASIIVPHELFLF
jgi:hypothetical protein